ncbi:allene oxide cyclase family protein [Hyalangium rubrum]|uniref:allene-oxide cyclase n=1 Tax=Hyalangium rubrum TaxID=3103134 RepID=A0ABU5HHE6_9BACT|nr:allene oxide cyclase family protein [Hyalangium sp. s54d21]MDY7232567.1 dirigent protein [Hyalangium sp. s54d21]
MRRTRMKGGLGLVLLTALVGCGDEEAAPLQIQTIQLVERAASDAVVDNEPAGDSAGDVLTFSNLLFDATNTTQMGTDQGYCVRMVAGESWECTWTAFLSDGQLTVSGPFYDRKGSVLAITGGTGAFKGAHGQMQLEFRDSPTQEYTFIYQVLLSQ